MSGEAPAGGYAVELKGVSGTVNLLRPYLV